MKCFSLILAFCCMIQSLPWTEGNYFPPVSNTAGHITDARTNTMSSKEYGDDYKDQSLFPAYLKPLFAMKSSIQSSLYRIQDGKYALEEIKAKKQDIESLLESIQSQFDDLSLKCVVIDPGSGPVDNPAIVGAVIIGNKCYIVSDHSTGFLVPTTGTYDEAVQSCLKYGGILAQPSLMAGSSWGSDLSIVLGYKYLRAASRGSRPTLNAYTSISTRRIPRGGKPAGTPPPLPEHWIAGTGVGTAITTPYGYVIPSDYFRYLSVANFPSTPPTVSDTDGLVLAGPISEISPNNWFIDILPLVDEAPYICEFPTTVVVTQKVGFRLVASTNQVIDAPKLEERESLGKMHLTETADGEKIVFYEKKDYLEKPDLKNEELSGTVGAVETIGNERTEVEVGVVDNVTILPTNGTIMEKEVNATKSEDEVKQSGIDSPSLSSQNQDIRQTMNQNEEMKNEKLIDEMLKLLEKEGNDEAIDLTDEKPLEPGSRKAAFDDILGILKTLDS